MSIGSPGEDELGGGRPVVSWVVDDQPQQLFPNYLGVAGLDGTKFDPIQRWWQGQI